MGDWENYFNIETLKEGEVLYRRHGVHDHKQVDPSTFTARVFDEGRTYYLSVHKNKNGSYDMHCSCEKSTGVHYCRHLAAAMRVFRFSDALVDPSLFNEAERMKNYFNMGRLTAGLNFDEKVIEQAKQAVNSAKVIQKKVRFSYMLSGSQNENYLTGTFTCVEKDGNWPITIEFDREHIRTMRSHRYYWQYFMGSGYGVTDWQMIAGLLLLDRYITQYNPGDDTDFNGSTFMQKFASANVVKKIIESNAERKVIHLAPRIIKNGDRLTLSFRIGTAKMYVLKSISELVKKYEEKGAVLLGKKNEIHFSEETFTDDSMPYFEFIRNECRRIQAEEEQIVITQRYPNYYLSANDLSGSDIMLGASSLDAFYELSSGKKVEFSDRSDMDAPKVLYIGDSSMHIGIHIKTAVKDRQPSGITLQVKMPDLISGAKYTYFIQDGKLSRLSTEAEKAIEPFLDPLSGTVKGLKTMQIGKKHLSEFYYQILPVLEANPIYEIEEEYGVADTIPPEAFYHFYLDAEDDQILCRAEVSYDEKKYDLKKLEDTDFPLDEVRDANRENQAVETIEQYLPFYDPDQKTWLTEKGDDALFALLDTGIKQLMEFGEVKGTDAFQRLKIRRSPVFSVGVSVDHNLLDLELLTKDISPEELLKVLKSYREKKKYHRLSSGEFISMDQNDAMDTLEQLMDAMNLSVEDFTDGKLELPVYRALYVSKLLEEHDNVAAERDRNFRNLVRSFHSIKDSDLEIPKEIKSQLRNYQIYGVRWMHTLAEHNFGGILADDMGLGKTIQMIALLDSVKDDISHPSLIICPASVVYNWEEEFHRFAPDMRVKVLAGSLSERKDAFNTFDAMDVYITSYDLVRRDIGLYKDKTFSFQVLDEGQYIKNPKSVAAKSVKVIHSEHRFVLTGTPIENRLSELWSIFDYLMPGFLFTYPEFRDRYELLIAKQKDETATEALRKMVAPFILRRLKSDVLKDLPEKIEEVRYARFGSQQQKLYDGQLVKMKNIIQMSSDHANDNKIKILAELTKLREICCDPSMLVENYDGDSAKTDSCMELLANAVDGGHRVLVFSQFTKMLEILEKHLDKTGLQYYKITGSTPKEERMRLVHEFNDSKEVPIFLISLKAGGTGLNLTGADVVIHYDPWWNLAAENQATDRAHRIGQKNTVAVYKLIIKDSVEEKVMEIQNAKRDLADAVLSGESVSLSSLSKEELMELLA